MSRILPWVLLVIALIVIGVLVFRSDPPATSQEETPTEPESEAPTDFDIPRPKRPKQEPADDIIDPELPITQKLATWQRLLVDYQTTFRSLPTGSREEILAALSGKNSRKIEYISPGHPALEEKAYFFHVLSSQAIEVRHWGEDEAIFTEDDHVLPPFKSLNIRR